MRNQTPLNDSDAKYKREQQEEHAEILKLKKSNHGDSSVE